METTTSSAYNAYIEVNVREEKKLETTFQGYDDLGFKWNMTWKVRMYIYIYIYIYISYFQWTIIPVHFLLYALNLSQDTHSHSAHPLQNQRWETFR